MWLATRHEGFDGSPSTGRQSKPPASFLDRNIRHYLRTGLGLSLLSLLLLIVSHYLFEGEMIFTWDHHYTTPEMRANDKYRTLQLWGCVGYLFGGLYLAAFQAFMADDAAWSRGYRAGSKLLAQACIFNLIAAVLQVGGALNFSRNHSEAYWTHYRDGSIDWIFGAGARVIHGLGWILFGCAFFLLEIYHDEGTNDWHGCLNLFLFVIGGALELLVLFSSEPSFGVIVGVVSLISAWMWSMSFEQETNETSPRLNESELCNELEKEIDRFVRSSPLNMHQFNAERGGQPQGDQIFQVS